MQTLYTGPLLLSSPGEGGDFCFVFARGTTYILDIGFTRLAWQRVETAPTILNASLKDRDILQKWEVVLAKKQITRGMILLTPLYSISKLKINRWSTKTVPVS